MEEIGSRVLEGGDSPYPNFSKQYSKFWQKGSEYIQDDWREEGINHLNYWREYFNDEERIKTYSHYPFSNDGKSFNNVLDAIRKQVKAGNNKESVLKNYWLPDFDINDDNAYKDAVKQRWDNNLNKTKSFIEETTNRLITL